MRATYRDLADRERLVLVLTCTPLHCRDEGLPDALNELRVGQRLLLLPRLDGGDDVRVGIVIGQHLADGVHDALLHRCVLPFGPPLGDLGQARPTEVLVEDLIRAAVRREEGEQVADAGLAKGGSKVIHRLLRQVCAENHSDDVDRNV
jgi:hypothetical protein